jgi:hypothetical protein
MLSGRKQAGVLHQGLVQNFVSFQLATFLKLGEIDIVI